MGQCTWD
jgi:hypothetical protein